MLNSASGIRAALVASPILGRHHRARRVRRRGRRSCARRVGNRTPNLHGLRPFHRLRGCCAASACSRAREGSPKTRSRRTIQGPAAVTTTPTCASSCPRSTVSSRGAMDTGHQPGRSRQTIPPVAGVNSCRLRSTRRRSRSWVRRSSSRGVSADRCCTRSDHQRRGVSATRCRRWGRVGHHSVPARPVRRCRRGGQAAGRSPHRT